MTEASPILDAVEGPAGFTAEFGFMPTETERIKQLIEAQWISRIRQLAPGAADRFAAGGISRYHENVSALDHGKAWPKPARILPRGSIDEILAMSLFRHLEKEIGPIVLSDEEGIGYGEMYWRLVRPNEQSDVGPLHCDSWFWELGHGTTPPDVRRVKVWTAIVCEPGLSGLRVVPGSHRKQYPFHGELRDGFMKPCFDLDESTIDAPIHPTSPGRSVIFHDRLLHGGAVSGGNLTRVSFEFTLFVPETRFS